jgi:hypothetical protein
MHAIHLLVLKAPVGTMRDLMAYLGPTVHNCQSVQTYMWANSPLSDFSLSAATLMAARNSKQWQGKGKQSDVACARNGSLRSALPLKPSHAATTCHRPRLNRSAARSSASVLPPAAMLLAAAKVDCCCGILLAAGSSSRALKGISCCGDDRSAVQQQWTHWRPMLSGTTSGTSHEMTSLLPGPLHQQHSISFVDRRI